MAHCAAPTPPDPPPAPPHPSKSSALLAPGFRFHPTDEELVGYYLRRKISNLPLRVDAIAEVDLYKMEPWDLPALSRIRSRDVEWYFFSPLGLKPASKGAVRTNRATGRGYWKTTGKDREVKHRGKVVGMKKTLVYHLGRAPKGERTNWVMHEYRLEGEDQNQVLYSVCRVFQKQGPGPQNGAQYGAPLIDEEWDEGFEDSSAGVYGGVFDAGEHDEYIQMGDLSMETATENASDSNLQEKNCGMEDLGTTLEDILNNSCLVDNAVEPAEMLGQQNSSSEIIEAGEIVCVADQSLSPLLVDGYVEMDDFANAAIADSDSNSGSIIWPSEVVPIFPQGVSDFAEDANALSELHFSPLNDSSTDANPNGVLGALPGVENCCFMPDDVSSAFYDAPIGNIEFPQDVCVQPTDLIYPPVYDSSSHNALNELFFDASEEYFNFDLFESIQNLQSADSESLKAIEDGGFTVNMSEKSLKSNYPMPKGAATDHTVMRGDSKDHASEKSYGGLLKILGAVTAPPASAAECPQELRGMVIPASSFDSKTIIRAAVKMHTECSVTSADECSRKSRDFEHLSYSMEDHEKMNCCALSGVLRGGFCTIFVSAAILAVSYTVGLFMCSH